MIKNILAKKGEASLSEPFVIVVVSSVLAGLEYVAHVGSYTGPTILMGIITAMGVFIHSYNSHGN